VCLLLRGLIKAEQEVSQQSNNAYESYFWSDTTDDKESSDDYDLTAPRLPKLMKHECAHYACQRMMT
jgi:hypothetical protein